ncbi:STAS domain-containing protein [Pseudonocardia bannensis]|uniref:STAS domain-containing protein n=2 Tax=Pseudonocardia bannensis TaxID=630973 RepID=A0A848DG90_9PSEU|nr:STAS domain-containing protein [Pseudonocardia bannensis]
MPRTRSTVGRRTKLEPAMPNAPDQTGPGSFAIDLERPSPSTLVCTVRGEIDIATATAFRTGLERTVGTARTIVIDLGEVTFIGSIAVAIILDVLPALSDVQALKVVTRRSTAKVFEMLALTQIIDFFPDRSTI